MKRVIICLLILAGMLTAGIALYIRTETIADELISRLSALGSGELSDPVAQARSISDEWEDFCAYNVFLTNLEGAAEVSETLVRLISKARCDPEDVPEECVTAICEIELFRKSRQLRIENVF